MTFSLFLLSLHVFLQSVFYIFIPLILFPHFHTSSLISDYVGIGEKSLDPKEHIDFRLQRKYCELTLSVIAKFVRQHPRGVQIIRDANGDQFLDCLKYKDSDLADQACELLDRYFEKEEDSVEQDDRQDFHWP